MSPLMVSIGGKRARIHGVAANRDLNTVIRPPARRLMLLKDRAISVWTGTDS
jgi:hypothetical protein